MIYKENVIQRTFYLKYLKYINIKKQFLLTNYRGLNSINYDFKP